MYNNLIKKLREKGVQFDRGLTATEVSEIENRYHIHFPYELLRLYSIALPVSNEFYNWRDTTNENIMQIKYALEKPKNDLKEEAEEIYWNDIWGEEPDDAEKRKEIILCKIQDAPQMIPVYAHRYLANIDNLENPVFSIHGSDVICYAKNLYVYLQSEFDIIERPQMLHNQLEHVPFWNDLL